MLIVVKQTGYVDLYHAVVKLSASLELSPNKHEVIGSKLFNT